MIRREKQLWEYVRQDFDGLHYLNYLCDCHFCGQMLLNGFEQMKAEVGNSYSEKIRQKFYWHMNYINAELNRKDEIPDRKYRLTM